jgi:serine protease AprX
VNVSTRKQVWGLAVLALLLVPSLAPGQSRRVSHDLERFSGNQAVDVIIQYSSTPSQSHFDRVQARGGSLRSDLRGMKAGAFHVPAAQLAALANDPDVSYISLDRPVFGSTLYSNNPDFYDQAVLVPSSWNQYDGTGIGIAVIDSGISSNADFGSRIVYSQSFVKGQTSTADAYGHGTHVAGILAGNGANSTGSKYSKTFLGIANNANLINLRVLDQNGASTDSEVIAAIQEAITLKSKYNIRIINLSLGRGVFEGYAQDPLCQAVESAWKAGIVVIVAAGNDGRNNLAGTNGYGTINAPGNDPYVITVGAMKPMGTPDRADDLIASYSSKGPTLFDHVVKPDIVAPGNEMISVLSSTSATLYSASLNSLPTNYYMTAGSSKTASTTYYKLNGTSMATPVVSGAAALLLQKTPSLSPDQLKARIMKTAYKTFPQYSTAKDPITGISYTSQYDIFTVGAGYLDIQNAMQSTDLATSAVGSANSPKAAVDASGNVYIVGGSSVVWGNSVTWGTSIVWGTSVVWGKNAAGESILWGSSVVWGTTATQASSVLWGAAANAACSVVWGVTTQSQENSISTVGEQ